MTKKIGRNDPCPCGSGKKYKNCCLRKDDAQVYFDDQSITPFPVASLNAPQIKAYFKTHDTSEILDYLIALQLTPDNHGKNMRLERMAQLAIHTMGQGDEPIDTKVLKHLIDEEYEFDVMEDIPMNMFCENVVFFGGNYLFFPGLSTHATELFCAMTETIYNNRKKVFSEEFKQSVFKGVILLLEFGNAIAHRAGIMGMTRGSEEHHKLISEPANLLTYGMPEDLLLNVFSSKGVTKDVLDAFVLDIDNPKLLAEDIDENPLLYKPIVRYDGCCYFIGVNNQGPAINNYILKQAKEYGCLKYLVEETQYSIWMRIGMACSEMIHWSTSLTDEYLNTDARYNEALFEIDTNWIAYVTYAKDVETDVAIDGLSKLVKWNLDSRLKSTLSNIRKDPRYKDYHILTLVLYSSMGESFLLTMNKQPDTDYLLTFSAFEFLQLVQTEKWEPMSLVRFARTVDAMPFFKRTRNQSIDMYSFYKHYGETFYYSDEERPTMLQIEPNDGYSLIKESKEMVNSHGVLMHLNEGYAYIPVRRDMNYANIYRPINTYMQAKCCGSYKRPVWVRCSQTERKGTNPTSFVDTVITAIAFWMEKMEPSLGTLVKSSYTKPVDIEVSFDEDILKDKELHHEEFEPRGEGVLRVSKTTTGVAVFMDRDYLRSFMGASNESERDLMNTIVKALLDLREDEVTKVIDEFIPLGQAKMILMMEASNIPLTNPLWLYPPIYIHHATDQLLHDKLPIWMKESGKDIEGKIETLKGKVHFLHDAVDVLLSKLADEVTKFDKYELIIRLIHNHETLVYKREHDRTLNPAQILCFGESKEKRKEFFDEEQRLTNAGLATRALIEYLTATQENDGKEIAGNDDVESMMAIMIQIVDLGGICDALYYDMSDHVITKLPSGRYGIYDDEFVENVGGFASARSRESINNSIEGFASRMEQLAEGPETASKPRDSVVDKIDDAFLSDWGVTYSNLLQFLYASYTFALKKEVSVVDIEEVDLIKSISSLVTGMNETIAKKCLERLALDRRQGYLTPPEGYSDKDVLPWCYNRELSFLRRPYIRYHKDDGKCYCLFGFRSCLQACLQLTDLLHSGRLKNGGKEIEKILGFFEAEKGKEFNDDVRAILNQIPSLKVWSYDVKIKPKGNLVADDDYGDIDVLAYNETTNTLYSIECKNTNTAKNIREMKKEMDEYLGRGDNPEKDKKKALVLKHLRRHKWLIEHMDKVLSFIGVEKEPVIKSMMLTASVIPTSYLKKEKSPLSILNYQELKLKGLDYLDSSKEPDLSVL